MFVYTCYDVPSIDNHTATLVALTLEHRLHLTCVAIIWSTERFPGLELMSKEKFSVIAFHVIYFRGETGYASTYSTTAPWQYTHVAGLLRFHVILTTTLSHYA